MEAEKLVTMANQIGDFYEAYPNEDEAKKGIAMHLQKFWNSVMIQSIVEHVQQNKGAGLHPRVADAIRQYIVS